MGLRDTIQGAVETAFAALGDVPELCTYTQYGSSSYAATTGVITPSTTAQTSVPVILDAYEMQELDNDRILDTDQKALIASNDLTMTPQVSDTITRPDESVWRVEAVGTDPAGAMWELQVRKP